MNNNTPKDNTPQKNNGWLSKISNSVKRGLQVAQNPTNVQHSISLSQFLDSIGGIPEDNQDMRFQEINGKLRDYFSKMTLDGISKELEVEFQKRPNGRTLKLLGFSYYHSGQLDNAIKVYMRALEITAENPIAIYEDLGRCYILKGDLDQASKWFGKSYRYDYDLFLDIFGLDFLYITAVGRCRWRPPIFGEKADAFSEKTIQMELMADALSIQEGNKKGHKSLFNGPSEEAVIEASKEYAADHQKVKEDTEIIRNDTLQLLQELKATKWLKQVSDELHKGFPKLIILIAQRYCMLGIFFTDQNRLKEAENAYQRAIAIIPEYAAAHYNLGNLLTNQNRIEEAEDAFRNAIANNPSLAQACSNLGVLLANQNRFEEAEAVFRKAIDIEPNKASSYSNLGNLLRDQNRLNEAESFFQKALKIDPNHSLSYFNLGILLERQNRFDEAEKAYRKAIETDPNDAPSYLNLSILLSQQDHPKEAWDMLQKARRLDSKLVDDFLDGLSKSF